MRGDSSGGWIQRFSASERALHWANAVPFTVLFATGVLMLLRRMFGWELLQQELSSQIHRVSGFVLLGALFLALWRGSWKQYARLLRDFLTIGRNDLRWGMVMPLRALGFKLELPPVGRFNLGQKTNAIVQLIAIPGLAASGLAMFFVHGILLLWWVHLAFFLMSLPLFLVHLFMALINPSTRPAMRGITSGKVRREWAEHHHPEWVAERDRSQGE